MIPPALGIIVASSVLAIGLVLLYDGARIRANRPWPSLQAVSGVLLVLGLGALYAAVGLAIYGTVTLWLGVVLCLGIGALSGGTAALLLAERLPEKAFRAGLVLVERGGRS